mmetsp:Transcript_123365/g.245619  ORF Transcript_123365/g.245619 Transcript_123365/m.245619 type:complete len:85 (+) Transcript_123365:410-664(+)
MTGTRCVPIRLPWMAAEDLVNVLSTAFATSRSEYHRVIIFLSIEISCAHLGSKHWRFHHLVLCLSAVAATHWVPNSKKPEESAF